MSEKEDFMKQCIASGKSEADCTLEWGKKTSGDSKFKAVGDVDLMRKINMLEAQLQTRETQLRQAIDIANRANDERKAKEQAEKLQLIDSITIDGKWQKDELTTKNIAELQTIRMTLDKAMERTFASVAAEIDAEKKAHRPHLTAGAWDSKTQTWKGGL